MGNRSFAAATLLICAVTACVTPCFGQSGEELPRLGLGAKMSSLGFGVEAATAVTSQSNVRGGFNVFTYGRDFSQDGITYGADLKFRSIEVHYDWFLSGSFHISPG